MRGLAKQASSTPAVSVWSWPRNPWPGGAPWWVDTKDYISPSLLNEVSWQAPGKTGHKGSTNPCGLTQKEAEDHLPLVRSTEGLNRGHLSCQISLHEYSGRPETTVQPPPVLASCSPETLLTANTPVLQLRSPHSSHQALNSHSQPITKYCVHNGPIINPWPIESFLSACLHSCWACTSSCNEMLIRLHIYRANLCVHIQVLLIHSIAS